MSVWLNPLVADANDLDHRILFKETLIESEISCGTGMCRPKSNNLAVT